MRSDALPTDRRSRDRVGSVSRRLWDLQIPIQNLKALYSGGERVGDYARWMSLSEWLGLPVGLVFLRSSFARTLVSGLQKTPTPVARKRSTKVGGRIQADYDSSDVNETLCGSKISVDWNGVCHIRAPIQNSQTKWRIDFPLQKSRRGREAFDECLRRPSQAAD